MSAPARTSCPWPQRRRRPQPAVDQHRRGDAIGCADAAAWRATEAPHECPTTTARRQPRLSSTATTSSAQADTEKSAVEGGVGLAVPALVHRGDGPAAQPPHDRVPEGALLAEPVQQQDRHAGALSPRVAGHHDLDARRRRHPVGGRGRRHAVTVVRGRVAGRAIGRLADHGTERVSSSHARPRIASRGPRQARRRRRRRHGHDAAGRRPVAGRLPGVRGLQRDPQRDPPRAGRQRARRLLRRRRRLRRDQHLRREPRQPRRVRHPGAHLRARRGRRARSPDEVADDWSTPAHPRWVLGSVGPGTKLPSLGHAPLRRPARRLRSSRWPGSSPAAPTPSSSRPRRTCSRPRRPSSGPSAPSRDAGVALPIFAQVTVETTGTMLLGSEIGAALTAAGAPGHRHDRAQLRHRAGRDERAPAHAGPHVEHRHLGHAQRRPARAHLRRRPLPAHARPSSPTRTTTFTRDFGLALVGGCCGTTPEHLKHVVDRVRGREVTPRKPHTEAAAASLYQSVPFRQDTAYLSIGERTNANGSKAFREAMLEQRWDDCVEIARDQIRDGAHLLDLCVDYVGRDGVADMQRAGRPARHGLDPADRPGLHRARSAPGRPGDARRPGRRQLGQLRGRRRPGLADSAAIMPLVVEHGAGGRGPDHRRGGPGPHGRLEGARGRSPHPRPDRATGACPSATSSSTRLTFPIATGQEETRRDGIETIEAIRQLKTPVPGRPDDPRPVQRLLRPEPRRPAGAQLGVPARVHRGGPRLRDRARVEDPADVEDPGRAAAGGARPRLRPPRRTTPTATSPTTRCSASWSSSRASRRGRSTPRRPRSWPRCRCSSGWSGASSTGSGRDSRSTSTRRCRPRSAAGDRQRHPARRHEGGRGAVRPRARCSCRSSCRARR